MTAGLLNIVSAMTNLSFVSFLPAAAEVRGKLYNFKQAVILVLLDHRTGLGHKWMRQMTSCLTNSL